MAPVIEALLPRDLYDIYEKVQAGERLSGADGVRILTHPNLAAIGMLADLARHVRVGDHVYYNNAGYINYSNVCVLHNVCKFCAFGKTRDDPDAYTFQIEEMVTKARAWASAGITEIHMVGGLHPDLPFEYYTGFLSAIKRALPHVHLKAFTAVEIDFFARKFKLSLDEVLDRLQAAGHGSITGGGAEQMHPEVHDVICKGKMSAERYLEVHRLAHRRGIRSNATMLYGTVEEPRHVVYHLERLRELQDETGGFQCFVPLAFHPTNTELAHLPGPTGWYDLRIMATSRLLLDNFRYIKAYWVMMSPRMAQVSLRWGANDVDGTIREERIYHLAGSTSPLEQSERELVDLIRGAGLIPAERDPYYRILKIPA
ncbi:aminodeoxyfutalosine synthase [Caldinitratiruptor microaerophilus]|uniref:Aminodeoxyfutalosine synthase n=1 Tax=Caldinitratiruptor microaerophilus TaxID=671077 RepID=A0AA35CKF1_9FIRM|nr:aminodeoxyfutalosine synthase [Caldinitratiruptor microaerophilus]